LVAIKPNLQAWLSPYRHSSGRICPENPRKLLEADCDPAGLLVDWPQNALRHSFGSYHLAHFKNAPALALQMGNSPGVIFGHYRELVKPAAAALYWQILPNRSLRDLREWNAFYKGVCFSGEEMPVSIRQKSMEHIQLVLTQHLLELKQQAA
jgi:hypothetical protein